MARRDLPVPRLACTLLCLFVVCVCLSTYTITHLIITCKVERVGNSGFCRGLGTGSVRALLSRSCRSHPETHMHTSCGAWCLRGECVCVSEVRGVW